MGKKFYIWGCVVLMVVSSLILGWSYFEVTSTQGPNQSVQSKENAYIRTNNQGAVRVSAEWLNPLENNATTLTLDVSLDTHSVNLDQYDLKSNTDIRVNNQSVTSGVNVEKKGAGHHVTHILKILIPDTIQSNPIRNIQLTIKNLDNVPERVLTWNQ